MNLNTIKDLPEALTGLREDVRVLVRSNGTPTYLAKDIAHHMWKLGIIADTFKYSKFMVERPDGKPIYTTSPDGAPMPFGNSNMAINIIDSRQDLPQMILAFAFKLIDAERSSGSIVHMSYGKVEVEGGLSGRKGTWLEGYTADHLLEEATAKARSAMGSKFQLSHDETEKIAKSVAIASIKFEYLRFSPEKQFQFSWERAMNFEGASGPYCQYMRARAVRMLEDSGVDAALAPNADFSAACSDHEFALIKQMSIMGSVMEKACRELRPNAVAEYASDLASTFSGFYENVPVLKSNDEKQRGARLAITSAFARTMERVLGVLGIEALRKM
jgi:arginyl-tRNA synthetase